jgi:hypothetical protein
VIETREANTRTLTWARIAIWLMNGTTPTFEGLVGTNPGPTWHIHAAS